MKLYQRPFSASVAVLLTSCVSSWSSLKLRLGKREQLKISLGCSAGLLSLCNVNPILRSSFVIKIHRCFIQ